MFKITDSLFFFFLALPRAPLKASTTIVEATYVVISWERSPDDKGRLTYALDCLRCEVKYCLVACSRTVRYSPKKENITGINVTITGLSPSSFFLFRIYSVNELNQHEKDKEKWKYAEVFVGTKGRVNGFSYNKFICVFY